MNAFWTAPFMPNLLNTVRGYCIYTSVYICILVYVMSIRYLECYIRIYAYYMTLPAHVLGCLHYCKHIIYT